MSDVAIIMGSQSDWPTMEHAATLLDELEVSYDARIVSAHRTPDRMVEFAKSAREQGFKVIIAGAGGAAHLPGMVAAMTTLPVLGVPVESKALKGQDSLLSIVQMPGGVPVGHRPTSLYLHCHSRGTQAASAHPARGAPRRFQRRLFR